METERKIRLLQAEHNLKEEVASYEKLVADATRSLERAKEQLGEVQRELGETYDGGRRFTDSEVKAARQGINHVLGRDKGLALREIQDELPNIDGYLVERELRKLAHNTNSPVMWNGKRGVGSLYYRLEVA